MSPSIKSGCRKEHGASATRDQTQPLKPGTSRSMCAAIAAAAAAVAAAAAAAVAAAAAASCFILCFVYCFFLGFKV